MKYMGIDQSLSSTGICIVDDEFNILRCETIKSPLLKNTKLIDRIDLIAKRISLHLEDPEICNEHLSIVREGYSYGSKSANTYQIGELGGAINYNCFLHRGNYENVGLSLRMYSLPPTTVKKFCLGNGATKKDSMYLLKVFKKTDIEFTDDNQADAYMLCKTMKKIMDICRNFKEVSGVPLDTKKLLIASSVRKSMKITDSCIKDMSDHDIAIAISSAVQRVYAIF